VTGCAASAPCRAGNIRYSNSFLVTPIPDKKSAVIDGDPPASSIRAHLISKPVGDGHWRAGGRPELKIGSSARWRDQRGEKHISPGKLLPRRSAPALADVGSPF